MLNTNDTDETILYPQTEEDRIICQAKLTAFTEMRCWIENVTNQKFSHCDDFRRSLSDGFLLCNLLNCLKPGSIKRINRISTPIAGYECSASVDNIAKFLRVCEEDFGLRNVILFETSDLEDLSERPTDMTMESDRRLLRVLICLFHLAKSVEDQLTKVTLDSRPFKVLLQSQDHKEIRRLKSNSISVDSNHEAQMSKLIHNQNHNYLATRAYETLNRTKANQDNLIRSSNDEEWQESLENWKEKRRQVISNTSIEDGKEERNIDNQELLELKERARKMKLLRDQLKDQSTVSEPQKIDQLENGDSKVIPNIDDETMAMIERVKQKKLAEENKRKFSLSPQLSAAFASDSEQSTSTAVDRPDDETHSVSEKIEVCDEPCRITQTPLCDLSKDNTIVNNPNNVTDLHHHHQEADDVKTRLVNIKLVNRSKQDSDQLWGIDVIDGANAVTVSKVKIGSCADVCDIRKGDEIVSINSEEVSTKSVEYIRSIFNNCASVISGSDAVTLCLRRNINDDEEAEFYSSDQSGDNQENELNSTVDTNEVLKPKVLHEHEINEHSVHLETIEIPEYPDDISFTAAENIVSNTNFSPEKSQESQLLAESCLNYKDESSGHLAMNLLFTKPDMTNTEAETDIEKQPSYPLSVQDKITKIESQKVANSIRLSSSWNVPKSSTNDPVFSKSTSYVGQSIDRLCWNADQFKYRQFGSGNSSLSNLYHYWETEAPKSVSSSQTNKITKSAPIIQSPIRSTIGDKEKSIDIDMEIAEQQFDTSNGNLEQTWRNVHSSGNSSTSDDVSALNETIIMPQYKAPESNAHGGNRVRYLSEDNNPRYNPIAGSQVSRTVVSTSIVDDPVIENKQLPTTSNLPKTNTSTGIQADLIQCRKPANYTNITTAFKSRSSKAHSYQSSHQSDDDTCSITISNAQDLNQDNAPVSSDSKESSCKNVHSMDIVNMNDMSKDYTTVTAVTQRNENPRKFGTCTSLSSELSITGVSENNEKSVEIEVSITPQLFPIRHKTLIQKPSDDKYASTRSNDLSTISNISYAEDVTLQSDYVKVTDLDDVVSPIRDEPLCHLIIDSNGLVPVNDVRKVESGSNSDLKTNSGQSYVKMRKKHIKNNSAELPIENGRHSLPHPIYSDNKSHSLISSVDSNQSISTVPVPTLFKSGPKSENTLSQGQMSSRSDSGKSKKLESILSSKKLKNRHSGDSNSLSESKRSSSTKELRFQEFPDDKDWNVTSGDNSKRAQSYTDDSKHKSSNHTKYSTAPKAALNSSSELLLPGTTNTRTHTKSYSIDRSVKHVSSNPITGSKVSMNPIMVNVNETKTTMKCNYCGAFVGLEEDLMVIEELSLHFHLKCFICSECKRPLGDGKSDTDVRIRRSKLHCMTCYHKKSTKSRHRVSSTLDRTSQPGGNVSQSKGGIGDGLELHVHASGNANNCAMSTNNNNLSSGATPHGLRTPLPLQISYLDTF